METMISFEKAIMLTKASMPLMGAEKKSLNQLTGRILSADLISKVNSPSVNASLKDGYAVISSDIEGADQGKPITLTVSGNTFAGNMTEHKVTSGCALRVTTGAPVPKGVTAIIAEEFCRRVGDTLICLNTAPPGKNILEKGSDIKQKGIVALKGDQLTPALVGLIASAGIAEAYVYKRPRVAVMATGDEVVAPGSPLPAGKLYASNIVEICSWLSFFGLPHRMAVIKDDKTETQKAITALLPEVDAFITTGGAWGSEKDLLIKILDNLGWQGLYHRVRMGPGKGVGYGLLNKKPFFCLPGGPPSCEIAFLELTLPHLLIMSGNPHPPFQEIKAKLKGMVKGDKEWTQFIPARVKPSEEYLSAEPLFPNSRLQGMAEKDALIKIPEGIDHIEAGEIIKIKLIKPGIIFNYDL